MEESKLEKYSEKTRIFKILREAIPYIVIILVVVIIRTFIATPVRVNGVSMYPTLKEGEILILNKLDKSYKRFDIVVVKHDSSKIIKRIVGFPGETIDYIDCKIHINGVAVAGDPATECDDRNFHLEEAYNYVMIPAGYYFVMGDNRNESSDSRDPRIGIIKASQIEGTAKIRIFPFNKMGGIK